MEIHYENTVTSTSDHILVLDKDMALVYSDYQTKGRGQRGNSWESESGKNLTFSFMLKPKEMRADKQFVISKLISISLINTLKRHNIVATIKWPNDIYVADKKIAGILIENVVTSSCRLSKLICGIGLNVNQSTFVSNAPNPISMGQISNCVFSREDILDVFCEEFKKLYTLNNINDSSTIDKLYWEMLYRREQWCEYVDNQGRFEGMIVGVGQCGELMIEKREGNKRFEYLFKEVSYVIR